MLASVEVKLADVYGLVDGGCVPRCFVLQVSCSFFEREGFPPFFFCDLKGSIGRVDQIKKGLSKFLTHSPILSLF